MIFKIIILSHCVLTVDYLYIVNHPFDEICVPSGKMKTICFCQIQVPLDPCCNVVKEIKGCYEDNY